MNYSSRKAERDPQGSRVRTSVLPRCHLYWMGRRPRVAGLPNALVSGITELAIDLIYSKEIPCLLLRLGKNMMLLEAHGHSFSRQISFPAASIVTV